MAIIKSAFGGSLHGKLRQLFAENERFKTVVCSVFVDSVIYIGKLVVHFISRSFKFDEIGFFIIRNALAYGSHAVYESDEIKLSVITV